MNQSRLYEAANEFEWAARLMPDHPDPRMNLALVLERAGRTEDALAAYATALEVRPGHVPTVQAYVRCQLKHGRADDRTSALLEAVALRGTTSAWRDWARTRLAVRESVSAP